VVEEHALLGDPVEVGRVVDARAVAADRLGGVVVPAVSLRDWRPAHDMMKMMLGRDGAMVPNDE